MSWASAGFDARTNASQKGPKLAQCGTSKRKSNQIEKFKSAAKLEEDKKEKDRIKRA